MSEQEPEIANINLLEGQPVVQEVKYNISAEAQKAEKKKASHKPRVSILMGVYNCPEFIRAAVESMLKQTFKDFEFIIIDDTSTDNTYDILKGYAAKDKRIRLYRNKKNIGLTRTLIKFLPLCRGEYIARMDGDDISLPKRLEKQVKFLDANKDIMIVGTWADVIDPKGRIIGEIKYPTTPEAIHDIMVRFSPLIHPSVVFRRKMLKLGTYHPNYFSAQDYQYFARVVNKYDAANLPEKLFKYRWNFEKGEGFLFGRRQQKEALQTRWWMITKGRWPFWHFVYMIKPLISYCMPMPIKKKLILYYARKKVERNLRRRKR